MCAWMSLFGDSILRGVVQDEETSKYRTLPPDQLEAMASRLDCSVVNQSRFGCTITKGAKLVQSYLQKNPSTEVVLLEYGGNDCDYNWQAIADNPNIDHAENTPLSIFLEEYSVLIDSVRQQGVTPVLLTLTPLHSGRFFDAVVERGASREIITKWLGDTELIYRHHEAYSNAIAKLAQDKAIPLIDIRSPFLNRLDFNELIGKDGIHPTQKGYQLILDTIMEFFLKKPELANGYTI